MEHDNVKLHAPGTPFHKRRRVTLQFCLPYYTQWGQSLAIVGSDPAMGSWISTRALAMSPRHEGGVLYWIASLQVVPEDFSREVIYSYLVVDHDSRRVLRQEFGAQRSLRLPLHLDNKTCVHIYDLWQDASSPERFLFRTAFQDVIFQNKMGDSHPSQKVQQGPVSYGSNNISSQDMVLVRFKICCPRVQAGQNVCLVGDLTDGLHVRLLPDGSFCWEGEFTVGRCKFPVKYRYAVKDDSKIAFEDGEERELGLIAAEKADPTMIIVDDGYFKANPWRGAGVAVPVFSLRSEDDVGTGEFLDLKLLVDISAKAGLHLIQLLPINDTSVNGMWWDSYPYSSLSVFALHPLYLRLQCLSKKLPQDIQEEIQRARKKLNLKDVDYDATMAVKVSVAKKIFKLEKDEVLGSAEYRTFFQENQHWLKPYAAFCYLRDFFGTSDHSQWGTYSKFSKEKLEKLVASTTDHFGSIAFNYYLQYHLHLQLSEAANYARSKRIVLKGDLPIGVDRNSVDTWMNPTLFRMNTSTGAPPDYFDKNGQNWGFPTYNWEEMSKDNYGWWRARLTQMAKYFSVYRIDHVLGFFRIWELPEHAATGLMGRFRPSIPLSQEELESEGVWDFDRLSKPYIRCHLLQELFGEGHDDIAKTFLKEYEHLCYEFKEEFNTEKKVVKALELMEASEDVLYRDIGNLKEKLIDLLQEVVLLRDPEDSRKFYPRFNLDQTASFRELEDGSKHVLGRLYHDYYFQRQEDLWRENALKTLPVLLSSSDMLACGEDLGLVPACVQPVLRDLGLVGLRIQRMPTTPGTEFAVPASYEYATVCSPSCHDTSTLRAWWEEDENRRARFLRDVLYYADKPPATCDTFIVHAVLQLHMEAPSMWAIFPLQDILALKEVYAQRPATEESINDPTNPRHYWRFRVHVMLESLLNDMELLNEVNELVESSGRSTPSALVLSQKILQLGNGYKHTSTKGFVSVDDRNGQLDQELKSLGFEENGS